MTVSRNLRHGAAIVAFSAAFVAYNINLRGIGSRDSHVTGLVALNLASRGAANVDAFTAVHETGLARGYLQVRDGHVYSNYPLVPALIAAPAYWLMLRGGWLDPSGRDDVMLAATGKIVASALTALACAMVVLLGRSWVPALPPVAVALAIALATPLWSSASQALWSHAAAVLFLCLGLLAITRASTAQGALVAGMMFGLATACRPLLGFFLAGGSLAVGGRRRNIGYITGALLVLGPLALYNEWIFGTPLGGSMVLESADVHQRTHLVSGAFSGNVTTGLLGILVSPSRGILIFAPIAVLAIPGALRLWKEAPLARWVLVAPLVAYILAWSQYAVWWGGHTYGPRYAADIAVPAGLLAAAGWPAPRGKRVVLTVATAALGWSIAVQAIGAFYYPNGDWNGTPRDVDRSHDRLWAWRDSQVARTVAAGPYAAHLKRLRAMLGDLP